MTNPETKLRCPGGCLCVFPDDPDQYECACDGLCVSEVWYDLRVALEEVSQESARPAESYVSSSSVTVHEGFLHDDTCPTCKAHRLAVEDVQRRMLAELQTVMDAANIARPWSPHEEWDRLLALIAKGAA